MQTARYSRAARSGWPLMVVLAVLGAAALGLPAAREPDVYRAEVRMLVSFGPATGVVPTDDTAPRDPAITERLMQRRVKTYAARLDDPRLTVPVIATLKLPDTPQQLARRIRASSPVDSYAIDLTVDDRTAEHARTIAAALAGRMTAMAERERPVAALPVTTMVMVESGPSTPRRPLPRRWPSHTVAGFLAGLAIGLGVAVLRDGVAQRRRWRPVPDADVPV